MRTPPLVWVGMAIGSTLFGMIPGLWGAGLFSLSGLFLSTIGGLVGIYVGFKLSQF